jgi:TonB-linked SusC/RagA family outer membrane protein
MMKHNVDRCMSNTEFCRTDFRDVESNDGKQILKPASVAGFKQLLITLLFTFCSVAAMAQGRTITGDISDETTKESLAGVAVTVKGTTQGTISDADGNFSLEVKQDAPVVLTVSYMGFESADINVGTQSSVSVKMKPATGANALSDVVVVGYGTQKERNVTGAISKLNADNFDERPVNRLEQALVGQIAGVQVKQTSGAPGRPFSIQIRGAGSLSAGNEPLYVIDGFPLERAKPNGSGNFNNGSPLDNINPNDIETIEVLKDAAAAAIYGSRAANGVVIITTKRGKSGKPQISVNSYFGFSRAQKKLDMLTAEEWIARAKGFIDTAWVNSDPGRTASQTTAERLAELGKVDPKLMYDERWDMPGHPGLDYIDWQDVAFRNGTFQNYQLSASGASDFVRYYISGNYQNQQGYAIGMGYKSFSARANVEATLTKKMHLGLNLAPTYSIKDDPGVEGKDNTLHKLITTSPVMESTPNAKGELYQTAYAWGGSGTDPMPRLEDRVGRDKMFRNLASLYYDVEVIDGLKFKTSVNFDNVDRTAQTYIPSATLASISGSYGTNRRQTLVNENTLSYIKTLGGKHNISALLGHAYNTSTANTSTISSSGNYTNFFTQTVPTGSTGSSSGSRTVLISYFGRLQYDFMEKYLISVSMRRDGSSVFGVNNKWGNFPAVSVGWRVSDEDFFKNNIGFINDFKLRSSIGTAGNNGIDAYAAQSVLGNNNYSFNGNSYQGRAIYNIPNPDLRWEKSVSNNYGVDFSIFDRRISGSFDYYTKRSSDLLLTIPVLQTTGFASQLKNIGEVFNKGWEVELRTRNLTGKFEWTTSVNLSHNTNKITSLDGQEQIEITNSFTGDGYAVMKVGEAMNSIYVVQQDGVLTQGDIESGYPTVSGQKAGDAKYIDANGDGKITSNDRVIVGQPNPKYFWGITNSFRYKNFDLNILVQGQNGGKIYSLLGRAINRVGMGSIENVLDVDVAERGRYQASYAAPVSTDWLYSSDYISIRSITLGYNMPASLKNKYIKGGRLYVTAENWFNWNKYHGGFNPEAANANLSNIDNFPLPGDYGGLPLAKSIVFGINLNF